MTLTAPRCSGTIASTPTGDFNSESYLTILPSRPPPGNNTVKTLVTSK